MSVGGSVAVEGCEWQKLKIIPQKLEAGMTFDGPSPHDLFP